MATPLDFPSTGKVLHIDNGAVVFAPAGTSYQLRLGGDYTGPLHFPFGAVIRSKSRKLHTVPSGGNFIEPIQGRPRIIQGWVLYADETHVVVHAGANFVVELPPDDTAISLDEGPIAVNKIVNITLLPGATFELAAHAAVEAR